MITSHLGNFVMPSLYTLIVTGVNFKIFREEGDIDCLMVCPGNCGPFTNGEKIIVQI